MLNEVRELASGQIADYQIRIAQYYDQRVKPQTFKQGDLVLTEVEASDPSHTGKLMPRWEVPYRVYKLVKLGTYQLARLDRTQINNTWHASRLRKYYQ